MSIPTYLYLIDGAIYGSRLIELKIYINKGLPSVIGENLPMSEHSIKVKTIYPFAVSDSNGDLQSLDACLIQPKVIYLM